MQPLFVIICSEPRSGAYELGWVLEHDLMMKGFHTKFVPGLDGIPEVLSAVQKSPGVSFLNARFMADLGGHLCSLGALEKKGFWGSLAKKAVDETPFLDVAIISGLPFPEDLSFFDNACKVWLYCNEEDRIYSDPVSFSDKHPANFAFDRFLADGVFDLSFKVGDRPVKSVAKEISAILISGETMKFNPVPHVEIPW